MRIDRISTLSVMVAALLAGCAQERSVADGGGQGCTQCHGYPPPPFVTDATSHPNDSNCSKCHAGTVEEDDITIKPGGLHMDGIVEAGGHADGFADPAVHAPAFYAWRSGQQGALECTSCHGADYSGGSAQVSCTGCHEAQGGIAEWRTNCTFCHGTQTPAWTAAQLNLAAPPQGVAGATDPADPSVGAHQVHLNLDPARFASPVSCATCHTVPAVDAATSFDHVNGTPALNFTGLAVARNTAADWKDASCATYCHGSSAKGGPDRSPVWTSNQSLSCTGCHGAPPPSHNNKAQHAAAPCGFCHEGYVKNTTAVADHHVNGTADVYFHDQAAADQIYTVTTGWSDCVSCHNHNPNAPDF